MQTRSPILITGVNGFIASHLAERLLREGIAVRGLARRPESAEWLAAQGVEVVGGDLLDSDALARAMKGCSAVVHAAAWTGGPELSPEQAWRTNVAGTFGVIDAARDAGVERVIYISSVAVYGLNTSPLIDESALTPPVGQLYPDSKIAAESAVRAVRVALRDRATCIHLRAARRGMDPRPHRADQARPAHPGWGGYRAGDAGLH